jgi:hypothetical protein
MPARYLRHGSQPEDFPAIRTTPMLEPFWAAGFSFSRGHFKLRVPYDAYQPMVFQVRQRTIYVMFMFMLFYVMLCSYDTPILIMCCVLMCWLVCTLLIWFSLVFFGFLWFPLCVRIRYTCRVRRLRSGSGDSRTATTSTRPPSPWCSTNTPPCPSGASPCTCSGTYVCVCVCMYVCMNSCCD